MAEDTDGFVFLDPGPLVDRELELVCIEKMPADPQQGLVPQYRFEMRVAGQPAGGIRLRIGNNEYLERYAGHIGYGVDEPHRGNHYAERAARLILPLARLHGFKTLWITCNPDNMPSRRTCERLGATMIEIVPVPPDTEMYRRGNTHKCRYRVEL